MSNLYRPVVSVPVSLNAASQEIVRPFEDGTVTASNGVREFSVTHTAEGSLSLTSTPDDWIWSYDAVARTLTAEYVPSTGGFQEPDVVPVIRLVEYDGTANVGGETTLTVRVSGNQPYANSLSAFDPDVLEVVATAAVPGVMVQPVIFIAARKTASFGYYRAVWDNGVFVYETITVTPAPTPIDDFATFRGMIAMSPNQFVTFLRDNGTTSDYCRIYAYQYNAGVPTWFASPTNAAMSFVLPDLATGIQQSTGGTNLGFYYNSTTKRLLKIRLLSSTEYDLTDIDMNAYPEITSFAVGGKGLIGLCNYGIGSGAGVDGIIELDASNDTVETRDIAGAVEGMVIGTPPFATYGLCRGGDYAWVVNNTADPADYNYNRLYRVDMLTDTPRWEDMGAWNGFTSMAVCPISDSEDNDRVIGISTDTLDPRVIVYELDPSTNTYEGYLFDTVTTTSETSIYNSLPGNFAIAVGGSRIATMVWLGESLPSQMSLSVKPSPLPPPIPRNNTPDVTPTPTPVTPTEITSDSDSFDPLAWYMILLYVTVFIAAIYLLVLRFGPQPSVIKPS